jgi:hypothetical protein
MRFRNKKTGEIYRHLAYATECTNSINSTGVVIYCKDDNEHNIFVRETGEFEEKFELMTGDV